MKSIRITKDELNSWNYIKNYYGLGFLMPGQIVKTKTDGKFGTVIGAEDSYLVIYFQNGIIGYYHPDTLYYLNITGEVINNKKSMVKTEKEINRNELYQKQVNTLKKLNTAFWGNVFIEKDFICYSCKKDILEDEKTLNDALNGILIIGCPFCYKLLGML